MAAQRLAVALVVVAAAFLVDCGGSAKPALQRPATSPPPLFAPRQVEATFAKRGIDLVDLLVYRNGDRPIERSYAVRMRAQSTVDGILYLYVSVPDAGFASSHHLDGRDTVRSRNVVVAFSPTAARRARRAVRTALAMLGR